MLREIWPLDLNIRHQTSQTSADQNMSLHIIKPDKHSIIFQELDFTGLRVWVVVVVTVIVAVVVGFHKDLQRFLG